MKRPPTGTLSLMHFSRKAIWIILVSQPSGGYTSLVITPTPTNTHKNSYLSSKCTWGRNSCLEVLEPQPSQPLQNYSTVALEQLRFNSHLCAFKRILKYYPQPPPQLQSYGAVAGSLIRTSRVIICPSQILKSSREL